MDGVLGWTEPSWWLDSVSQDMKRTQQFVSRGISRCLDSAREELETAQQLVSGMVCGRQREEEEQEDPVAPHLEEGDLPNLYQDPPDRN